MGKKINFELIKTNLKLILIPIVVILLLGGICNKRETKNRCDL